MLPGPQILLNTERIRPNTRTRGHGCAGAVPV